MTNSPEMAALLGEGEWVQMLTERLVADPQQADDLRQSALVRGLERPLSKSEAIREWVARVPQNVHLQAHRRTVRRELHERAGAR